MTAMPHLDRDAMFPQTREAGLRELQDEWLRVFEERTPASWDADQRSAATIARTQRQRFSSGLPYPIYIRSGDGAQFEDLDSNRFLDLTAGWNAAMLGRGNPEIAAAVAAQMAEVGAPGGAMHPTLLRDEFASRLVERVPGAERIIFAPSGSEANAFAIRLCRAYTGKETILRMEGGYHGQYDYLVGGQLSRLGLPASIARSIVEVPFNDVERSVAAIRSEAERLCAVVVEAMMIIPGAVHQRGEFLQQLRTAALEAGVPFVLDEVITGSRFAVGGAAEFYELTPPPDLMVYGKMLGGGLPVAAVAGRAEIIEQPVTVSNTHAQNPVTLAAALASFEQLDSPKFERTAALGERLRQDLRQVAADARLSVDVTGDGPCCGLHFTAEEVTDYASARDADQELWRLMCLGVANQGLSVSSRTFGPIVPFDDEDIDRCVDGFRRTLAAIGMARGR